MHGKVGEIDFREEHFHKNVCSMSTYYGNGFDDQLTLRVQPVVKLVAMNRASLDKTFVGSTRDSLFYSVQNARYRFRATHVNGNGRQYIHCLISPIEVVTTPLITNLMPQYAA